MKILYLVNDMAGGQILAGALKFRDHEVTVVASVPEGIGYIDGGYDFRLVIVTRGVSTQDGQMVDGVELARNIRARGRQMPIILVTDRVPIHVAQNLMGGGIVNHVALRPYGFQTLAADARRLGIQL